MALGIAIERVVSAVLIIWLMIMWLLSEMKYEQEKQKWEDQKRKSRLTEKA